MCLPGIVQGKTQPSHGIASYVAAAHLCSLTKTVIKHTRSRLCTHLAYIYIIVIEDSNTIGHEHLYQFAFSYDYALLTPKILKMCSSNVCDN